MRFFTDHRKNSLLSLLFVLCVQTGMIQAQVTSFPSNNQLYPRDLSTNKATILVSGSLKNTTAYTQVRLKKYRNGVLQTTSTLNLVYNSKGIAKYNFSSQIPAELANYKFSLYGFKNNTETLIKSANKVVAGDAYIIQGQSNAVANLRGEFTTENDANNSVNAPKRDFVRVYGSGSSTGSYTKAWFVGDGNAWYETNGNTGQWGMRMGSNIAAQKKVPVAIFNGGSPGSDIAFFQRNEYDPADQETNYGRLLKRIQMAGLQNNIRALIWYQGESDVEGALSGTQLSTDEYKLAFNALLDGWKTDYPGLSKFYLFQIRFGCGMSNADNCLKIQEAQRQLDKESTEILTISPANTSQLFDGGIINYCHFNFYDGYRNMGDWISKLIRRDLYNETTLPAHIESPEPETASFSIVDDQGIASQLKLTLKNQSSAFSLSGDLSSLFRLDGGSYNIESVDINGNDLLINFSRNDGTINNPVSVSYLGHDQEAAPVLTNASGLALINFEYFPVSASPEMNQSRNQGFISAENTAVDNDLVDRRTGKPFLIYPNPASTKLSVSYLALQAGHTEIEIFDFYGKRQVHQKTILSKGQNLLQIDVTRLKPGMYMIRLTGDAKTETGRFIVGSK
jgi:hypothetical protein